MAKKKAVRVNRKACSYCEFFFKSSDRTAVSRFCRPKDDYVNMSDEVCESFSPRSRFWCEKMRYWINNLACVARRQRRLSACQRCNQFNVIEEIIEYQAAYDNVVVNRRIKKLKRRRKK